MNYSFNFFMQPIFYVLLVLGCLAMVPRARYTAARMNPLRPVDGRPITPTPLQRICLFLPGICVFACLALYGYVTGAVVLLVLFLVLYVGLVFWFKAPSPAAKSMRE